MISKKYRKRCVNSKAVGVSMNGNYLIVANSASQLLRKAIRLSHFNLLLRGHQRPLRNPHFVILCLCLLALIQCMLLSSPSSNFFFTTSSYILHHRPPCIGIYVSRARLYKQGERCARKIIFRNRESQSGEMLSR